MARARSPDSIKAEEMFRSGMKLVEIAEKLGVPAGTVRRWKSTQKWEVSGETKTERSEKKESKNKPNVRKPGAPKGNKNAVGAGAPEGNKNAEKHGAYSSVYWDVLEPDELEMIDGIPTDEELLLIEQIQLFAVRERRIMKAINKYSAVKGGQYVSGVINFEDRRKFKTPEEEESYKKAVEKKVKKGERLPGERQSIQTSTGSAIDLVSRLERELTSVQSKKTKAIEALSKLRIEKQRIAGDGKDNDVVKVWAEKVLKARREQSGQ